MEQISEQAARVLALRYETQILALQESGAKLLGECAVRRMLEAMRAGCLDSLQNTTDNDNVTKQLVDVIVQVEKKQGILSLKHMPIPTRTPSTKWNEQAIFKKPGIRTIDGEFFHSPTQDETDVAQFGYRFGTKEEAKTLGYVQSPNHRPSTLELLPSNSMCFHTPSRGSSKSSLLLPQTPRNSDILSRGSSTSTLARGSSTSTLARGSTTPRNLFASPPPPPYQSPAPAPASGPASSPANEGALNSHERSELEELRKLVLAQQSAMAAMQTRMERMEALMLAMSAKVFPK